tara:strand:- start:733 stop:1875 length:1143 start_codon:yes stop_codon:yes gene_type:complete
MPSNITISSNSNIIIKIKKRKTKNNEKKQNEKPVIEKTVIEIKENYDLNDAFDYMKNININNEGIITEKEENNSGNEYDSTEYCSICRTDSIRVDNDGLLVCYQCGNISDKIIDQTAEWRFYGSEDSKSSDPTRCGLSTNVLLPESSLGTVISCGNRDSYEMKRIRKYHTWNAMPYKERSLYNVFDSLSIRAVNNGIPACIVEDAKAMYKVLSEARISRGSNRKGLIASCIYVACKKRNVPRSAKEIADIFKLDITSTTRGCKKFMEIWNMANKDNAQFNLNATKPSDFIQRFCSRLDIQNNIYPLSNYIADKAVELSLVSENTPPSIAAGSIYLASTVCNGNISKKDISQACKISEVTISKCYKVLYKYRKHILPKNYL